MNSRNGARYVVMALLRDDITSQPEPWAPVVVGAIPRRPWRVSDYVEIRGRGFVTWRDPSELRNPHIEEVAWNDPLLLGPFNEYRPHGVQHYGSIEAAQRNLERLVLFAAKKTGLRSSATEQPLRKRQVEGLSPSGGSKWIRRQEYARAMKIAYLEKYAAKGWGWAAERLAKLAVAEN